MQMTLVPSASTKFPSATVKSRLDTQLKKIASVNSILRPAWEPLLDSLSVVEIVSVLDDLVPFKIAPDKLVKKGGYASVEQASSDVHDRLEKMWNDEHSKASDR